MNYYYSIIVGRSSEPHYKWNQLASQWKSVHMSDGNQLKITKPTTYSILNLSYAIFVFSASVHAAQFNNFRS